VHLKGVFMSAEIKQPLVSVIIPSYNRASVLAAVQSVLDQTYKNIEVIVVDDCSPIFVQNTLSAIADPRLRVIRQDKNRGVSAARNRGVKEAAGEVIAFLDDDDKWLLRKLERQIEVMGTSGCDASITQFFRAAADKVVYEKMGFKGDVPVWAKVSGLALLIGSGMVIRKDKFLKVGPFNEQLPRAEDWEWLIRARNMSLKVIEQPLLVYAGAHKESQEKEVSYVRSLWKEQQDILNHSDHSSYRTLKMAMILKEARWELERKNPVLAAVKIGHAFVTDPVTLVRCAAYCIKRAVASPVPSP
jgi:glycosyltransferase involved in cell wall biosynthesis